MPSSQVVILLNGCRKTAQAIRDCNDCKDYFSFADAFADAFYVSKNMGSKEIEIEGKDLMTEGDFYLEFEPKKM